MDALADALAVHLGFQGAAGARLPELWLHLRATLLAGADDVPEAAKDAAWAYLLSHPEAYLIFLDAATPPITEAVESLADGVPVTRPPLRHSLASPGRLIAISRARL
jgi:hypothetical protein